MTSAQLDALARTANAEAVRLERREAPKRDAAQRKLEADDARLAKEQARLANKAAFQPDAGAVARYGDSNKHRVLPI